jgi:hypothetical protein
MRRAIKCLPSRGKKARIAITVFAFFVFLLLFVGCAGAPGKMGGEVAGPSLTIEEAWGIEIQGIRLVAADYMLDFRYRVLYPEKAMPILDYKIRPYLIDQASGVKFGVPTSQRLGAMRTTNRAKKPMSGKIYYVFFANPGKFVKSGNKVTIVIGDFKLQDMVVQ